MDGINLHFVQRPSSRKDATPLLLLHGWPDCFFRSHKVFDRLSEDFHVVVASVPGAGFQAGPRDRLIRSPTLPQSC